MNDLKLVEATPEYAEQLWQFRSEVFEHDPDDGNRFAGCMSIESASFAEEWIKMCQLRKSAATCKQGGVDVPSTTYFAVRKSDNKLVGVIDLRHHINHPILGTWGGHCGYTVRPSERGKGYAKEMLRLNIQNAKALGINKLLITCYPSNKASEKVIRANGGVYEKTVDVDGIRIQRFWIEIASKRTVEITDMELSHVAEYADLFVSVFNAEPWNDSWTKETAQIRIENMMKTGTFIGKGLYTDNDLKGIIWGQKEQYYNGTHFQIQEFCVKTSEQNKGYGNTLLKALEKTLSEIGVKNIYLITSKGEKTEGYYAKRGFSTSGNTILMTNHSFMSSFE